ncbi:MAG: SprT-like family-domain-containing protein [Benniella sp.]|nr:MAG: SprT-like family-domain-containing protein [Benniella sp.]
MEQSDEELARILQEQEYEAAAGPTNNPRSGTSTSPITLVDDDGDDSATDLGLDIDSPFKDLHSLFLAFNDQYFESKLSACEVRWSPRMTRCAGLCLYQSKAQYCSIRLSEPLLKFRPESDYIDTLLHEMIHAYLFVTKAIQDHDGHGADFQYHMNRINKAAGTTISIYHTFHDEVRYYQTHVWKCNGPCQHQPPYYGIVKRSMNRPPQPADRWFAEHEATCGGTYTKISAPEPTKKKSSTKSQKNGKVESEADMQSKEKSFMDNFFSVSKTSSSSSSTSSPLSTSSSLPSSRPSTTLTTGQSTESSSSSSSRPNPSTASESGSLPLLSNHKNNDGNSNSSSRSTGREAVIIDVDATHSLEPQWLPPREAAAAAALARFEKHLKTLDKPPPPPSTTTQVASPSVLKRKDSSVFETTTPGPSTGAGKVKKIKNASDGRPTDFEGEQQGCECTEEATVTRVVTASAVGSATSTANHDRHSPSPQPQPQPPPVVPSVSSLVQCPICSIQVEEATINDHVDLCIWQTSGKTD